MYKRNTQGFQYYWFLMLFWFRLVIKPIPDYRVTNVCSVRYFLLFDSIWQWNNKSSCAIHYLQSFRSTANKCCWSLVDSWWSKSNDSLWITYQNNRMDCFGYQSRYWIFPINRTFLLWKMFFIRSAGGMTGADIGVGWVDQSGRVYFQVYQSSLSNESIQLDFLGSVCTEWNITDGW